jgi:hypothetical protein
VIGRVATPLRRAMNSRRLIVIAIRPVKEASPLNAYPD